MISISQVNKLALNLGLEPPVVTTWELETDPITRVISMTTHDDPLRSEALWDLFARYHYAW